MSTKNKKDRKVDQKTELFDDLNGTETQTPEELAEKIGGANSHTEDYRKWAHEARSLDTVAANLAANGNLHQAAGCYETAAADWKHAAEEDHADKQYMANSAVDLSHSGEEYMQLAEKTMLPWSPFGGWSTADHEAERYAEQALQDYKRSGTEFGSIGESAQAGVAFENGAQAGEFHCHNFFMPHTDLNEAMELYHKAAQEFSTAGEYDRAGNAYDAAAGLYKETGHYHQAAENFKTAADMYCIGGHSNEETKAWTGAAESYEALAKASQAGGSHETAAQYYGKAADYFSNAGELSSQGQMLYDAGANFAEAGQKEKALSDYQSAASAFTQAAQTTIAASAEHDMDMLNFCYGQAYQLAPTELQSWVVTNARSSFSKLAAYYTDHGMTNLANEAISQESTWSLPSETRNGDH